METTLKVPAPDFPDLFRLFNPAERMPEHELIPGEKMPQPYNNLLVHTHHMTVTVEAFHGDLVNVHIIAHRQTGQWYARKILLNLQRSGKVVLFGIVRIRFRYCTPAVRAEIVAGQTPLGRVLIQNNLLRRIQPTAYFRLNPGPNLMEWFGLSEPEPVYGRLGLIYCDEKPAIELLEIIPPIATEKKV